MSEYVPKLVSIIITTCKRDIPVLERALMSAEAQTYPHKEIFVINDYPPYRAEIEEMLKRHSGISFISNNAQSGACISRNEGIEAAKGEFVALLDDDDEWLPQKLEVQMGMMDSGTGMAYCGYEAHLGDKVLKADPDRRFPEGRIEEELLASNVIGGCSIPLIRKSVLQECGGFDPGFRSCQDIDLWIRIAERSDIRCTKEVLSIYNVGSESITGSFDRRLQGWERLLQKYEAEYRKYPHSRKVLTGTIVREAAKRISFRQAFRLAVQYGRIYGMMNGLAQRILKIY